MLERLSWIRKRGPRAGAGVRMLLATALLLLGLAGSAEALPLIQSAESPVTSLLVNPNFDDGLTGWTIFTTPNGAVGNVQVVPFVTSPEGSESNAAQFNVGRVGQVDLGDPQGGGIFQQVELFPGTVFLSADIATLKGRKPSIPEAQDDNPAGGLFELLIDDIVIDSLDFGLVFANQAEFGTLGGEFFIAQGGLHTIAFRMTRPYLNDIGVPESPTPRQYIDNVVLRNVPEPHTALLLGLALLALALRRSPALARP